MPLTTLRVSLLALLCFMSLSANARLHSPNTTRVRAAYAQDSAAKPSRESNAPRASEDIDSAKAEELCARGEALSKQGDSNDALKLLDESVNLYRQIYIGPRSGGRTPLPPAQAVARYRSEMSVWLRRAPACIEMYTRLGGPEGASDFERGQVEALRAHAAGLTESDESRAVFSMMETDTRAFITDNPTPAFPRGARGPRGSVVSETVRFRVILGADGAARHALVLSGQHDALAEESVKTAEGIKFKPATKGGRPVSQFAVFEHNFNTF